jgi:transposase InsO family protein
MLIDMNEAKLKTIEALKSFLSGTNEVVFEARDDVERYGHVQSVIKRFGYGKLGKGEKGVVRAYLMRTTGYSRQQITRLIKRAQKPGILKKQYCAPQTRFANKYTAQDTALLAEIDALHNGLSGPATRHLLHRAFTVFDDLRFVRLATISVAHLYNLRATPTYQSRRVHFTKTRGKASTIGVRKAPDPNGLPGYIRIDSVHQGDQDGAKGVYYINAVDCITQWEIVACCEKISEAYLLPVIEAMLAQFPFRILGFHADNGSEYINHQVAGLLGKLNVEFTKSRPRHSNDNGLVETKNGVVIRKAFGYEHIPQRFAAKINEFCQTHLVPYLNFHRPCLFALEKTNDKGKTVRTYPQKLVMTPLEKLIGLPNVSQHLRKGVSCRALANQAASQTDSQAAAAMNAAQHDLFDFIIRSTKRRAA